MKTYTKAEVEKLLEQQRRKCAQAMLEEFERFKAEKPPRRLDEVQAILSAKLEVE